MAGTTKNFHLVPMGDRPYFLRATVVGLRAQLSGLGLDSSGLKVDLYLRLTNGGHSLYTDDRDQSDDDQSDSDQSDSDQPDSDQPGDDQPDDDGQGGDPPGGAGQKRPRNDGGGDDDDDNNGDDNQGSLQPPRRKTLRVGNAIPAELRLQIMRHLNLAQLWNLAMADPAGYLSDDINVFEMDAHRQHAIDYPPDNNNNEGSGNPPANSDDGGNGNPPDNSDDGGSGSGGSGSGDSGSSDSVSISDSGPGYDPNRPLSMLQWVGRRLVYDPAFGTAWRARILQLIDAYLQVYGPNDVPYKDGNVIQDMLSYFRVPALHGTGFPLRRAARNESPDIVHLLLLRGVPVDQPQGDTGRTALSEAVGGIGAELNARPSGSEAMHTIFALIGAGADVTLVSANARNNARSMLQQLMVVAAPGTEDWHPWPRIVNVRGLSVREFIADPRSDYFDRIRLAMYVIAFQNGGMNYPGLE